MNNMGFVSTYPPPTAQLGATPANPTGTNNATGVMMGLALSFTPTASGKVNINVVFDCINATGPDGGKFDIRFGTGTAPINGAALTGTAIGSRPQFTEGDANGLLGVNYIEPRFPFSLTGAVSLVVGTTYWFDLSQAIVTGSTVTAENISYVIEESTS